MPSKVRYVPFGDKGVLVHFMDEVNEDNCRKYLNIIKRITEEDVDGIIETAMCFNSILVHYDPMRVGPGLIIKKIRKIIGISNEIATPSSSSRAYDIPTLYGGDCGPDLEHVAKYNGLSCDEVVEIHSKTPVFVYFVTHSVLCLVSERLITPRRDIPRLEVPQGSVGIGDKQTAIYQMENLAGGFNIIGRTPLIGYDRSKTPPFILRIGDTLHFRSIDAEEFKTLEAQRKMYLESER